MNKPSPLLGPLARLALGRRACELARARASCGRHPGLASHEMCAARPSWRRSTSGPAKSLARPDRAGTRRRGTPAAAVSSRRLQPAHFLASLAAGASPAWLARLAASLSAYFSMKTFIVVSIASRKLVLGSQSS